MRIFLTILLLAWATAATAGDVEDCERGSGEPNYDADVNIAACTAVIHSGDYAGGGLAWAYYNRGNAYRTLDQPARAIEDYDQALRVDPDFVFAYNNRGLAYSDLGQQMRAIEDYDQALQLNPRDATTYYNRGVAYGDLGQHKRAIEDYDRAIRLDPEDAGAYYNRGIERESLGDFVVAVVDWEQSIALEGSDRVRRWQTWMRDHGGHYSGPINGVYGPQTRSALVACARDPEC